MGSRGIFSYLRAGRTRGRLKQISKMFFRTTFVFLALALSALGDRPSRDAINERLKSFDGFFSERVTVIHKAGDETKDAINSVGDELQKLLKLLADELKFTDDDIANVTESKQHLEQELEAKEDSLKKIQVKNTELNRVLKEMQDNLFDVVEEKQNCEDERNELESTVGDLMSSNEMLSTKINDLQENINQVTVEKNMLKEQLNITKSIVDVLYKEKEELTDKIEALDNEMEILQASNDDQQKKIAEKDQLIQDLKNQIAELEKKIKDLGSNESGCGNLQEQLTAAQKKIQDLLEEVRILNLKLEISHGGYQKVNGRYVKMYNHKLTWKKAKEYCKGKGSRLIVAKDKNTQAWIELRYTPMWIGATDEGHEGNWTWIDGTPVVKGPWNTGEPNNGVVMWDENCAAANFKTLPWWAYGKWSDKSCDKELKFACEIIDFSSSKDDGKGSGGSGGNDSSEEDDDDRKGGKEKGHGGKGHGGKKH